MIWYNLFRNKKGNNMTLSQMLYKIHKLIEAKELKVITQKEMARR